MKSGKWVVFLVFLLLEAVASHAQENSLLVDRNGDGRVVILAFGDSLTFGVGDPDASLEERREAGYPNRLETLLGVPVSNEGVPGEEFVESGAKRLIAFANSTAADIILLLEGTNDAFNQVPTVQVRDAYQRVINVVRALGKELVLMTLPTPCCDRGALVPYTQRYSSEVVELSNINQISFVDLKKAWETTCVDKGRCELYNLPEGLHPTGKGYDVMTHAIAATLLGIDIFAPDGAAQLEEALGLPPGAVLVKPEVVQ